MRQVNCIADIAQYTECTPAALDTFSIHLIMAFKAYSKICHCHLKVALKMQSIQEVIQGKSSQKLDKNADFWTPESVLQHIFW